MLRIYHNPQCKKSRAGLLHLQGKGLPFEIIEYIKNPLSGKQIEKLLVKLNIRPLEIVRQQEDYFRKNLKGKDFHDHEWVRILEQNPKLIQRPIVETEYKAVVGDPVDNINLLFK